MDEMNKLIEMLTAVGADFLELPAPFFSEGIQVVLFYKGKRVDDVVFAPRVSHGWEDGLLETFILGGCDGYETATQVFDGWEKMIADMEG